jgi:hypothetical protein
LFWVGQTWEEWILAITGNACMCRELSTHLQEQSRFFRAALAHLAHSCLPLGPQSMWMAIPEGGVRNATLNWVLSTGAND